jgi:hypothetical protein
MRCARCVQVLDTDIFLWYPPHVTGPGPSARSGHTASLLGDDLVIFGGSGGRVWKNTVHVLDTVRWGGPSGVDHPMH